jgi:uncharacterized delta-60 repeat protein
MKNNFKIQAIINLGFWAVCFFSFLFVAAQPGDIDFGFNSIDNGSNGDRANDQINTFAKQADGKMIIGGSFSSYNRAWRNRIARINADGTLDNSFNPGAGANSTVHAVALQSDGKIIIGGAFTTYGGTTIFTGTAISRIARLNADGSLDNTFNVGSGADFIAVYCIAIQPDGKIIIGGEFNTFNGIPRNRIARLNADGSLDNTFNPGTGANTDDLFFPSSRINTITLQPDGKIIIGGHFTSFNGIARNRIARLNIDGSLDATFNPGTGANGRVETIVRQADGKIIIGGQFTSFNGLARKHIARLNTNGNLDDTFDPGTGPNWSCPTGALCFPGIYTIALQIDGKIIIGGTFSSFNTTDRNRIARLNADGSLDTGFNPGTGANWSCWPGPWCTLGLTFVSLQSDGKIIIGGNFTSYDGTPRTRIARLNADGTIDNSIFNTGTGANGDVFTKPVPNNIREVETISLQPDGKIIIGGQFTSFNGILRYRIARLNSDGSLDNTFNPMQGPNGLNGFTAISISATALQSDGKIIIGGFFTTYNGITRNCIVRLNEDGSLDESFLGTGADNKVFSIKIQSDGKIIIGGAFTNYNGTPMNRIARLNVDGTLDTNFDPGTGVSGFQPAVHSIAIQSDGKIIIGGQFNFYNNLERNNIARLNTDGSLDAAFNPNQGADGTVRAIAFQSDGKIIIGGDFTSYNGTIRNHIARINTNGSLDSGFGQGVVINGVPWQGANSTVFAISIQATGKIIIGGQFSKYMNEVCNRIACLNADGALDTDFNPTGAGADNTVNTLALQPDGKIIVGGVFTSFNGTARNRITRIFGDDSPCGSGFVMVNDTSICGPAEITLHASGDGEISWFDNAGNLLGTGNSFNAGLIDSTTTFQVSAVAGAGCDAVLKTLKVTVNPHLTPDLEIILTADGYTCNGSSVDISAPVGYASYLWSNGATSNSITVNQAGMYSLTVVDANGCIGGDDEIEIFEDTIPVALFTHSQQNGYTVQFNNTSSNGSTYFWDFGGGNSSTQENPEFTYSFDGIFPVTLIVSNPCGSDTLSYTIEVFKLSAGNIALENSIQVFPNPFHESFQVSIDASIVKRNMNINVFNMLGQKVYTQQLTEQASNTLLIEFNNRAKGVYIIQLCNDGSCISKRLINN